MSERKGKRKRAGGPHRPDTAATAVQPYLGFPAPAGGDSVGAAPKADLVTAGKRTPFWPWALAILLLVAAVYGQCLSFGLVEFDDSILLTDRLRLDSDISRLPAAFVQRFQSTGPYYRPLQTVLFMFEATAGRLDPFYFHLTNLLIHAAACLLVARLLLAWGAHTAFAGFAGTVLAVHPLLAMNVAWIPGRQEGLLVIWLCLGLLALGRFLATGRWAHAAGHLACVAAGLLTKELGLVLVGIYALYVALWVRPLLSRRTAALAGGWVALTAAYLALKSVALAGGGASPFGEIPADRAVGFFFAHLRAVPELLGKLIVPYPLSPMPFFSPLPTLIGLAGLAALTVLAIRARAVDPRRRWFGLAVYAALVLPTLLTDVGAAKFDYLEIRAFAPAIGLLLFLGAVVPAVVWRWHRAALAVIALVVVIPLAIYSHSYCQAFVEPATFFELAVRTSPRSALALNGRGRYLAQSGDFPAAIADLDRALTLKPGYRDALENRGIARMNSGDLPGALADLNRAVRANPEQPSGYYNRGIVRQRQGNNAGAMADFNRTIELQPDHAQAYNNRGILRMMSGDSAAALADLDRAVALSPERGDVWYNRGIIRDARGDSAGACADWRQAAAMGHAGAAEAVEKYCR
jgi:Flp pilus assembly protein TadD